MKEDMFDVLMYLFENYYMEDEAQHAPNRELIQTELLEAGFPATEINQAFDWLEGLINQQGTRLQDLQTGNSIRIFSPEECNHLDTECRGFLLFLEQMGILNTASREHVIERAMALDSNDFDIGQLKWVVLMVLFNQPGEEAAYAWMEDLVFDSLSDHLH
jgi:Smg protein